MITRELVQLGTSSREATIYVNLASITVIHSPSKWDIPINCPQKYASGADERGSAGSQRTPDGCSVPSRWLSGPEAVATVAVAQPGPKPERTEHSTLFALCESGDATPERIQEFLDLRADVNAKNEIGATPLHSAAVYDENIEVVIRLIKAGADVNAKEEDGNTPLVWATSPRLGEPRRKNAEDLRAAGGKLGEDL